MEYKIEFKDKAITPGGSIILMRKFLEKMKIIDQLKAIGLPGQNSK